MYFTSCITECQGFVTNLTLHVTVSIEIDTDKNVQKHNLSVFILFINMDVPKQTQAKENQ